MHNNQSSHTNGCKNQTVYSSQSNMRSQQHYHQRQYFNQLNNIDFVFSPVQLQNKLQQKQQFHKQKQQINHNYQQQINNTNINNNNYYYNIKQHFINTNNNEMYSTSNYINNKNIKQYQQQYQQSQQFINSNSIVKRYQLLLITLLIMASIASVRFSSQGTFGHIKTITDRFNMKILGNTNPAIYQYGDNIDQSSTQFVIFEDINQHFDNLIEIVENFTINDSFIAFNTFQQQNNYQQQNNNKKQNQPHNNNNNNHTNCNIEIYYINGQYEKNQTTMKQLQDFLFNINRRQFLLSIKQMQLQFIFGNNKRLQQLNLTITYSLSSRMLLNIQLNVDYVPSNKYKKNSDDSTIRIVQQLLAFLLLSSYLHNAYTIKLQNTRLKKFELYDTQMQTLQTNRAYWCYSLVFLNIITMLNETYAPLASFLQLLPIFQRHDSANVYKYNFNTNLRYAIPIVMRIFIPVVILLNGFIFYSMLMYPGEYFQDYATGFFSYVYQNFQVGTYEIFIELENQGNFAYLLYGILYFYMVLVGSNLLPALFCTMIYIKIYQNDLKDHIQKTIKSAICPKCGIQNLCQKQNKQFQINIQSPKISPYLRGKLSTVQGKSKQNNQLTLVNKVTKMFVQSQQDKYGDQKLQLKSSIEKIKSLLTKLQTVTKQTKNNRQLEVFDQKIQNLMIQIQQSIMILSPVKSPLHRRG